MESAYQRADKELGDQSLESLDKEWRAAKKRVG
jgi:hypothetical protein